MSWIVDSLRAGEFDLETGKQIDLSMKYQFYLNGDKEHPKECVFAERLDQKVFLATEQQTVVISRLFADLHTNEKVVIVKRFEEVSTMVRVNKILSEGRIGTLIIDDENRIRLKVTESTEQIFQNLQVKNVMIKKNSHYFLSEELLSVEKFNEYEYQKLKDGHIKAWLEKRYPQQLEDPNELFVNTDEKKKRRWYLLCK
ncbi:MULTISPECIES: hypothetical protein [Parachlamydia]|jgi:hypothetical protein|uniref:hypothetical protein n=1 Tax=Parachlamydia TaxID=83551 RepID=UPI0024E20F93|nr:hypothetical protein [Parachlamydia acanthamoebae]